jgi:hypothetical protein
LCQIVRLRRFLAAHPAATADIDVMEAEPVDHIVVEIIDDGKAVFGAGAQERVVDRQRWP